jgi:hypothetical protein
MRGIVLALCALGAVGCAGTTTLPAVGADATEVAEERAERSLPREPEARWRVAPTEQGAALELRF